MRRFSMMFAVGGLMLLAAGSASFAQWAPPGSYQQTCTNIDVRNDVLTARCKDMSGNWQNAQLRDLRYCSGDISNENGTLRCNNSAGYQGGYPPPDYDYPGYGYHDDAPSGYGYHDNAPAGSYYQTCQDVRVHGDVLEATCQTTRGDWRNTRLPDFYRCGGDISNEDGYLRCTPTGYGAYQGYDSYTLTCRDIRTSGSRLDATCQRRNGGWRRTRLNNFDRCSGQIVNDDGNLRCVSRGYGAPGGWPGGWPGGYQGNIPGGTYSQTCQNIHVSGNRLDARCQTMSGGWRDTSLNNYYACRGGITNVDGHLRCGR